MLSLLFAIAISKRTDSNVIHKNEKQIAQPILESYSLFGAIAHEYVSIKAPNFSSY